MISVETTDDGKAAGTAAESDAEEAEVMMPVAAEAALLAVELVAEAVTAVQVALLVADAV